MDDAKRNRSSSFCRNGSESAIDTMHFEDQTRSMEDFVKHKKSSFKQRNRAVSIMMKSSRRQSVSVA